MSYRVCIIDVDDDCSVNSCSISSTSYDVGDEYAGIWDIDGEFDAVNGTVVRTIELEAESETEACQEAHRMYLSQVDSEPNSESDSAPYRYDIEGVCQEDIVDGLQSVSSVGPKRALAMVGRVNATEWTDLLDESTGLKDCVRDAITHPSVDSDTVEIVVQGNAREHNPDFFEAGGDDR